jgi:hypothetical protein
VGRCSRACVWGGVPVKTVLIHQRLQRFWHNERMTMPTTRDAILEALKQLPPDATLDDAMERLYFLSKLERGLAQSEARDLIPHEEVAKRFLK